MKPNDLFEQLQREAKQNYKKPRADYKGKTKVKPLSEKALRRKNIK